MSLRTWILALAFGGVITLGIWNNFRGHNAPSPKPPVPAVPADTKPAEDTFAERLPPAMPDASALDSANVKKATPVGGDASKQPRDIGTPQVAIVTPPDDSGDASSSNATGGGKSSSAPQGEPYIARRAKNAAREMFGSAEPPPMAVAKSPPAVAPPAAQAQAATIDDTENRAPFGRLVKCVLVNTLDSLTPQNAPVIALTTEPLSYNGDILIPANSEVFTYVNATPLIDVNGVGRLFDNGQWIIVLPQQGDAPNGRELTVKGRALDRRELIVEDKGRVRAWGLDDMAPGLIGYTVNTEDNEQIKLFVASFLGAAAKAVGTTLQTQQPTPGLGGAYGETQPAPTMRNAAINAGGSGLSAVMDDEAARISEEIKKRGFYVRVPAGKEFYLFIEQSLDVNTAKIGLHLADKQQSPSAPTTALSPTPPSP